MEARRGYMTCLLKATVLGCTYRQPDPEPGLAAMHAVTYRPRLQNVQGLRGRPGTVFWRDSAWCGWS